MKRRLAADLHGDGLGVIGQVGSAAGTVVAGQGIRFQLDTADSARGHVGFFEFGDILILRDADGTTSAMAVDAVVPTYWKVISRDRKNDRVVLLPLDGSFAALSFAAISTPNAASSVFYRYAQVTIPDLTGAIADYGSATEVIPGLEALVAADGRVVHGVTMSGATAGTQVDCGGSAIDVSFLEEGLSTVKVNVGQGVYSWSKLAMAPEARSALINAAETDRRFQAVQDAQRGFSKFIYQHEQDSVEMYSSEYCPKKRARALPKGKSAEGRVLELHMSDLSLVQVDGNKLFLKPAASGGGFSRNVQQFLEGYGTLLCKHPAAVLTLKNFTVS
jgi:hypothetical protein